MGHHHASEDSPAQLAWNFFYLRFIEMLYNSDWSVRLIIWAAGTPHTPQCMFIILNLIGPL